MHVSSICQVLLLSCSLTQQYDIYLQVLIAPRHVVHDYTERF